MPNQKDDQKELKDEDISQLAGGGPGIVEIGRRVHTLMSEQPKEAPKAAAKQPEVAPDRMETPAEGASKLNVKPPQTKASAEEELKALGAALEAPATQEASLSKFGLARKLLGIASDMMGKAPLDAGFAGNFERTLRQSSDQIAQLPDFYNVDGQMRDARPRKDAVMKAMDQLTGLFNALKDNSVGGLIKIGIGAALNLDGTLNQVLLPFVSAFSQFRAESKLPPMQQKAVEREATQSLVNFLKQLPFAIPTRAELEGYAKKIGVTLSEENQGELAAQYRANALSKESAALKSAFQKIGLQPETTDLIAQALLSPLDAGTRAAPLALSDVAKGVSDPYNQVLIGHMLDLAAQLAPMFVPAKGKPITVLSADAQKALGAVAETQPGLKAGLERLQSDKTQTKIQKKLGAATKVLPVIADVLKKADIGVKATDAIAGRISAQRDALSRNLGKSAAEQFSPKLEQAVSQNKFARFLTSIASTFTGRENPLTTTRKLMQQMATGQLDPTDFYNKISSLREKSPTWLKKELQGMMRELAGTQAKDIESGSIPGKIDEQNASLLRAGQNAAIDTLKEELAKAESSRGKAFDAFSPQFWEGIKTSNVTGFTKGDKEKLQNWISRYQVEQQVAFREAMAVINDPAKSPEERMKAVSVALTQAQESEKTLQELKSSISTIGDSNYAQIMGVAADKLKIPAAELPESIKASAATEKVGTQDALKSLGQLSGDPSVRLEQLKTARDQLKSKLIGDEMWRQQKLSSVSGYTKSDQQTLRGLTERLVSNLSAVSAAKESLKSLQSETNTSAAAGPLDAGSVEEEFRALKQLERSLQFVGDKTYKDTTVSLGDQVKSSESQLAQLEKLQLEAARTISDPERQTQVLRGLRNVASSRLQSDDLWRGLKTSDVFGFTPRDREEIRNNVKNLLANSDKIALALRETPAGEDEAAATALSAKANSALTAEVQRLQKITQLVRGANDDTYKTVKAEIAKELNNSAEVLAQLNTLATQARK